MSKTEPKPRPRRELPKPEPQPKGQGISIIGGGDVPTHDYLGRFTAGVGQPVIVHFGWIDNLVMVVVNGSLVYQKWDGGTAPVDESIALPLVGGKNIVSIMLFNSWGPGRLHFEIGYQSFPPFLRKQVTTPNYEAWKVEYVGIGEIWM